MSDFDLDLKMPRDGEEDDFARAIFEQELNKLTRIISNGLDEAAMQMFIAHLETKGYVIIEPTARPGSAHDVLRTQQRTIRMQKAQIAELESMLARAGGWVAP